MIKKILTVIVSVICIFTASVPLSACNKKSQESQINDEFTLHMGENFTVLCLPDVQITKEEWAEKNNVYQVAISTITTLVERVKPDFIALLGDLSYGNDQTLYLELGEFINSFGINWTLVWGNHDQENGLDFLHDIAEKYIAKFDKLIFSIGDKKLGNGNFVVKIKKDNMPVSALFFTDTHSTIIENFTTVYAKLTANQKKWYLNKIKTLKEEGYKDQLISMHIPLKAFDYAFTAANAYEGSASDITLENSYNPNFWNEGYKDSFGVMRENVAANPSDDFIETIIQTQMKATVIAAHDHVNNFVINYRGVKLAYALKTGIGCYYNEDLNGGTVVKINENGIYDLYHEYVAL